MIQYSDNCPHGIMFHHFHGKNFPKVQGSISAEDLSSILEFIGLGRILTAEEWVENFHHNTLANNHVCLTFDDGLRCQYEIAKPVLESYDLTAFWFVYSSVFYGINEKHEIYRNFRTTQFKNIDEFYQQFFQALMSSSYATKVKGSLENFKPETYLKNFPFYTENDRKFRYIRDDVLTQNEYSFIMDEMINASDLNLEFLSSNLWLTENHLKDLKEKNHIIGLHSYSHPTKMLGLSIDEQREQYTKNINHLNNVVGKIISMSHPSNSYNDDTLKILEELGIELGFRANMSKIGGGKLEFSREDHSNIMKMLVMK